MFGGKKLWCTSRMGNEMLTWFLGSERVEQYLSWCGHVLQVRRRVHVLTWWEAVILRRGGCLDRYARILLTITSLSFTNPTGYPCKTRAIGDFNAHHTRWLDKQGNTRGKAIDQWVETEVLRLLNEYNAPTRKQTVLESIRESTIDLGWAKGDRWKIEDLM